MAKVSDIQLDLRMMNREIKHRESAERSKDLKQIADNTDAHFKLSTVGLSKEELNEQLMQSDRISASLARHFLKEMTVEPCASYAAMSGVMQFLKIIALSTKDLVSLIAFEGQVEEFNQGFPTLMMIKLLEDTMRKRGIEPSDIDPLETIRNAARMGRSTQAPQTPQTPTDPNTEH